MTAYRETEYRTQTDLDATDAPLTFYGQHENADQFTQEFQLLFEGDRWQGVDWQPGLGGAPLLAGALAQFECANQHHQREGDHLLFIGRVERCVHRSDAAPLQARDHGGSGLGLSIVKAIADRHGARVDLSDPPTGTGLVVEVVFPAPDAA